MSTLARQLIEALNEDTNVAAVAAKEHRQMVYDLSNRIHAVPSPGKVGTYGRMVAEKHGVQYDFETGTFTDTSGHTAVGIAPIRTGRN